MAKTPTSSDLKKRKAGSKVTDPSGKVAAHPLAARLKRDRLKRKLTWPAYADLLGINLTTIYKIARGATTRPHELTVDQIETRLAELDTAETQAEGATREVVSSGQRHPEQSEG